MGAQGAYPPNTAVSGAGSHDGRLRHRADLRLPDDLPRHRLPPRYHRLGDDSPGRRCPSTLSLTGLGAVPFLGDLHSNFAVIAVVAAIAVIFCRNDSVAPG